MGSTMIWTRPRIYANFETDRVFLMGEWSIPALIDVFLYNIQKIAIDLPEVDFEVFINFANCYSSFKEILLFHGSQELDATRGIQYEELGAGDYRHAHWSTLREGIDRLRDLISDEIKRFDKEEREAQQDGVTQRDIKGPQWKDVVVKMICIGKKSEFVASDLSACCGIDDQEIQGSRNMHIGGSFGNSHGKSHFAACTLYK